MNHRFCGHFGTEESETLNMRLPKRRPLGLGLVRTEWLCPSSRQQASRKPEHVQTQQRGLTPQIFLMLAHQAGRGPLCSKGHEDYILPPSNNPRQERDAISKATLGSGVRVAALPPPVCLAWLTTLHQRLDKSLQVKSTESQNLPGPASPALGDSQCRAQRTLALTGCTALGLCWLDTALGH